MFSNRWAREVKIPYSPVETASTDKANFAVSERSLLILLALSQLAHQAERWLPDLDAGQLENVEDWASNAESELLNPAVPPAEPPYWDGTTGENADNEHPADTGSPWYEDLAWEFVEGFTATLVGAPAAHIYITVTKKLRLAYLKRDFGAIFNVEVDGQNVAVVDTYSATESIGFVDIVIP